MSVKIRLKRTGRKKQPSYRIVVMESRNARGGKVIDNIGHYTPYLKDKPLVIDFEKVDLWKGKGAIPSESVAKLLRHGRRVAEGKVPEKPETKKKSKAAAEPVAVAETTADIPAVELTGESTGDLPSGEA